MPPKWKAWHGCRRSPTSGCVTAAIPAAEHRNDICHPRLRTTGRPSPSRQPAPGPTMPTEHTTSDGGPWSAAGDTLGGATSAAWSSPGRPPSGTTPDDDSRGTWDTEADVRTAYQWLRNGSPHRRRHTLGRYRHDLRPTPASQRLGTGSPRSKLRLQPADARRLSPVGTVASVPPPRPARQVPGGPLSRHGHPPVHHGDPADRSAPRRARDGHLVPSTRLHRYSTSGCATGSRSRRHDGHLPR